MTISASRASLSRIQALQRCMRFGERREGTGEDGCRGDGPHNGKKIDLFSFGQGVGWFGWVVRLGGRCLGRQRGAPARARETLGVVMVVLFPSPRSGCCLVFFLFVKSIFFVGLHSSSRYWNWQICFNALGLLGCERLGVMVVPVNGLCSSIRMSPGRACFNPPLSDLPIPLCQVMDHGAPQETRGRMHADGRLESQTEMVEPSPLVVHYTTRSLSM